MFSSKEVLSAKGGCKVKWSIEKISILTLIKCAKQGVAILKADNEKNSFLSLDYPLQM